MKKIFLFILTVLIVTITACNKKDATITRADLLTTGSWILTAAADDDDGNGTYETENFSGFDACYKDNIWTFRGNGEIQLDEGPTKCDPGDPQTDIAKWQLTNNETTLIINSDSYSIQELSNSTLRLKLDLSGNRSSMVTFTKR